MGEGGRVTGTKNYNRGRSNWIKDYLGQGQVPPTCPAETIWTTLRYTTYIVPTSEDVLPETMSRNMEEKMDRRTENRKIVRREDT